MNLSKAIMSSMIALAGIAITDKAAAQHSKNYNDAKAIPITMNDGHTVDVGPRFAKAFDTYGNAEIKLITYRNESLIVISSSEKNENGKTILHQDNIVPTGRNNALLIETSQKDDKNISPNMERVPVTNFGYNVKSQNTLTTI